MRAFFRRTLYQVIKNGHFDPHKGDGHIGEAAYPGPTLAQVGETLIMDGSRYVGETFAFAWGADAAFCSRAAKKKRFRSTNHEDFSQFCNAMSNVRASVQAHAASASAVVEQPRGQSGTHAALQLRKTSK